MFVKLAPCDFQNLTYKCMVTTPFANKQTGCKSRWLVDPLNRPLSSLRCTQEFLTSTCSLPSILCPQITLSCWYLRANKREKRRAWCFSCLSICLAQLYLFNQIFSKKEISNFKFDFFQQSLSTVIIYIFKKMS